MTIRPDTLQHLEELDGSKCVHLKRRDGSCKRCLKDSQRGAAWASDKLANDPGFRREVFERAKHMVVKQREALCREAVMAAMRQRSTIEPGLVITGTATVDGKTVPVRKGAWWDELSPLSPAERGIVMDQLERMWSKPAEVDTTH